MTDSLDDGEPLLPNVEVATLEFPPMPTAGGIVMTKPPRCCYKKKMGNSFLCCEKKNSKGVPQVVCYCGSSWLCGVLTALHLYVPVLTIAALSLPHIHYGFAIVFGIIFGLSFVNCIKLSCCDPGVFPLYSSAQGGQWFEYKPGVWLPPRSKKGRYDWTDIKTYSGWAPTKWKCVRCCPRRVKDHNIKIHMSTDSGFLTVKTDHYCCWTGTIIAGRNMFNFRMMFLLTIVLIAYTLVIGMFALETSTNQHISDFVRGGTAHLRAPKV